MRRILGSSLRLAFFLLALMALVMICGIVGWYVLDQGIGGTASGGRSGGLPFKISSSSLEDTAIGIYLNFRRAEIEQPVSEAEVPMTFSIEPGETAVTIASRLEEMGLITDADLFRLYIRYHGIDAHLEAGDYELSPNMTMEEIAEHLQHSRLEEVTVTIPEGWRAEQVAEMLTEENILDGEEFIALVREGGDFDYDFLSIPGGSVPSLEGFLFPETYRLPAKASARDLIERMLKTFDQRFTAEMRQKAVSKGMTVYEVMTLASIVEREAVVPVERPRIASVYLNRLAVGMLLNADPTVQYAIGYRADTDQWWKTPVSLEEYSQVDSPYNTYLYGGLPPGPICSPGLASIQAVLEPTQTEYYYFVAKGDGSHIFAKTAEEHERNVAEYQR